MSIEKELMSRSGGKCELCTATQDLSVYEVPPVTNAGVDNSVLVCGNCLHQIQQPEQMDANHWRCLNDSMWSEHKVVQIMAWRLLNRIKAEGWPQDLLDMLYFDDEDLKWANAMGDGDDEEKPKHKDANGVELLVGDSVVLVKDLVVKGAGFTAKRGTPVRNIHLVDDNAEHIEGKVNGQQIVILTKYVKKTS